LLLTGLVVLRNASSQEALSAAWLLNEFESYALIYGYVGVSTALVLGLVGALLGRSQDALELSSVTDSLTGLSNHRHFVRRLDEELARAARYGNALSLLLLDLDDLKQINDRFGHHAGDIALGLVADCLRESCRATELAARSGGDEFAVLAPETTAEQAFDLALRIQSEIAKKALARFAEAPHLSVSIGVADLQRAQALHRDALTEAADRALYAAKTAGRNRTVLAPRPRIIWARSSRRPVYERVH
jgi:diguanylate cyclase (GGDEF)-like protein